jgi:hypothetical protein
VVIASGDFVASSAAARVALAQQRQRVGDVGLG